MIAYVAHVYLSSLSPFFRLASEGAVMMIVYAAMLLFVMGQKDFYRELFKAIGNPSSMPSEARR